MKRILAFGLLLALSLGCFSQNGNDRYHSQFEDCAGFGNDGMGRDRVTFFTANFAYGMKPSISFGVTFGMMRRFGWFVSVMTSPKLKSFNVDGEFDRDDKSVTMPFIKGDPYNSNTRLSFIAGGLVRITNPLVLRLGVGYGINALCYEGTDDLWFLDKKYSLRGLDTSLGLQLEIGKFLISADAVTTNFDMLEVKAGLGLIF